MTAFLKRLRIKPDLYFIAKNLVNKTVDSLQGVQRRMILVVNFFIFLRLLFFALLLLYVN